MTIESRLFASLVFPFLLIVSIATGASATERPPVVPTGFVHADGARLVDGEGEPLILRSVQFDNGIFMPDQGSPFWYESSENNYRRVAEMGFNCIRLAINYKQLENDDAPGTWKKSGFDWLDANIGWARQFGIGLILDMHVAQGGFQSEGKADALWE
jgi:endoglucanase